MNVCPYQDDINHVCIEVVVWRDTHVSYHSLIFRLKPEDVLIELFPRFAKRCMNMIQHMDKARIERHLCGSVRIEICDAVFCTIYVTRRECIIAMHVD